MATQKLSDSRIRGLKPKERIYAKSDGEGLMFEVHPNATRRWVLKFYRSTSPRNRAVLRSLKKIVSRFFVAFFHLTLSHANHEISYHHLSYGTKNGTKSKNRH